MNPKQQTTPYQNPWPLKVHIALALWKCIWLICCSWTPKFLNPWRLIVLRVFGANISGIPFVHSSARIQIPWHLKLKHRACLGERVCAYSLGYIELEEGSTVAQEVYLCTGTHDFEHSSMQLLTDNIKIGKNAFVGVRAMILPGVTIGDHAIVGAQTVISKDVPPKEILAGNPSKKIGLRKIVL